MFIRIGILKVKMFTEKYVLCQHQRHT